MNNSPTQKTVWDPAACKLTASAVLLLFLAAFSLPQFFIWSDLFIQEFDADVAESVIWAQASLESGSLINPDFGYTHILPFGGQFIFNPIVAKFGVNIFSLRLGLSIWSGIFAMVILAFFRSLKWNWKWSFTSSSFVIIFLTASELLREIFWAHVVHYNLSMFYLLLAMIFLSFCFDNSTEAGSKKFIGWIGFEAFLILGSTNGMVVVLFFSLALFFGIILEHFLNGGIKIFLIKEKIHFILMTLFGIIARMVLGKLITQNASTVYTDQFTVFAPADEWLDNFLRFPNNWLQMFSELPTVNVPFFSSVGIKLMIRIAAAFGIAWLSIRSVLCYNKIKTHTERIFIGAHIFISAATLFVYIFGIIYLNPWRITPMFFTGLITALIMLKYDCSNLMEKKPVIQLFSVCFAIIITFYAGIGSISVLHQPINRDFWTGQDSIIKNIG